MNCSLHSDLTAPLYALSEEQGNTSINTSNSIISGHQTINSTNITFLPKTSIHEMCTLLEKIAKACCSTCAVDLTSKSIKWLNNSEAQFSIKALLCLATAYKIQTIKSEQTQETIEWLEKALKACPTEQKDILLHYLVEYGHSAIIEYLLETRKNDVNTKNMEEKLPLHLAVDSGNVNAIQLILPHCLQLINQPDYDGNTPLHLAVINANKKKSTYKEIIEILLDKGACPEVANKKNETPFQIANKDIKNAFFSSSKFRLHFFRKGIIDFYKTNDHQIMRSVWMDALPLPIEKSFINLSIVKEEHQKTEEKKQWDNTDNRHQIYGGYEVVFKTANKEPIKPQDLFASRDGKTSRRLAVFGRAGIGKSTLCQYLAYQWGLDKGFWKDKFDIVFKIKLRNLTKEEYPNKRITLAEIIANEFFSFTKGEKQEKIEQIEKMLGDIHIRKLFLLDGYDEFPQNSPCTNAINSLIHPQSEFHVIVTSRPYAKIKSTEFDFSLECIGFTTEDIPKYLETVCPEKKTEICDFLKANPAIHNLAHIPLLLDILSASWDSTIQSKKSITITELYDHMMNKIWKRYYDIELKDHPEDVADKMQEKAEQFFEKLAFQSLKEHGIVFDHKLVKEVAMEICQCKDFKVDSQLEELLTPGFLHCYRSIATDGHQYSFSHLTIQEYFAANYLVRLLRNGSTEAKMLIQEIKFNPLYELVMWFVSGLLKDEGENFCALNAFFEALDTPKDLVGLYGTLLKVRCLEECGWQVKPKKIKLYEAEIEFWLGKLDSDVADRTLLALVETFKISLQGSRKFFIPKLLSYLSNDNYIHKINAAKAFGQLGQMNPESVIPALLKALEDKDSCVRRSAASALGQVGQADRESVIPDMIKAFKDEDSVVRCAITEAFGQLGQMSPKSIIPTLIDANKDKNYWVRRAAAKALSQVGQSDPKGVVSAFFEAFTDKSWRERCFAQEALHKISHADPESVIPILLEALKDKELPIRRAAVEALGKVGQADPKSVFPALLEAIKDEVGWHKMIGIIALGHVGQADPGAVIPSLIEALNDKYSKLRSTAVEVLGKVGQTDPKSVIPILIEILNDKDGGLRSTAITALGHVGQADPGAVIPILFEILNDIDGGLRSTALRALGEAEHADPGAVIPSLLKALNDEYDLVRDAAAYALGKLGQADPNLVIPKLIERLKDKCKHVITAAARALGRLGHADPDAIIPSLLEALNHKDDLVRDAAIYALGEAGQANSKVIPGLLKALNDEDNFVRYSAVKALGKIGLMGPNGVISALIKALKDKDMFMRTVAKEALDQVNQADSKDLILAMLYALNNKDGVDKIFAKDFLKKYDLSPYLKSHPEILELEIHLSSTPLTSLMTYYKEDPSQSSLYSAAIVKKCIEENLPLFQINNTLCCYEQGKLCSIDFPNSTEFIVQIENRVSEYPEFVVTQSSQCSIQ